MKRVYCGLMDWLYRLCIVICVISVVTMTGLIFTGVVMRYLFLMGARWAEPLSIFFAVQLTMYGAAACYRAHAHLSLQFVVALLPAAAQRVVGVFVQLLLATFAALMVVYGASLAETTWFQSYPEFDVVKVGLVYSAIPISGLVTLLFVVEAMLFRRDGPPDATVADALEAAADEQRRFAEAADEIRRRGLT